MAGGTITKVRWDGLFDDLEAQAQSLAVAQRAAEVETRTRAEVGRLGLVDRLRAAQGHRVRMRLVDGLDLAGVLERVGPDWLLLDDGGGREAVVAIGAVTVVRGLGRASGVPGSGSVVESRLGLRHALRGIARDRSAVRVHVRGTDGAASAATLDGTIDRVGSDYLELAAHAPGEARRGREVREVQVVALGAVVAVRRLG